jgi:hypothetical protein
MMHIHYFFTASITILYLFCKFFDAYPSFFTEFILFRNSNDKYFKCKVSLVIFFNIHFLSINQNRQQNYYTQICLFGNIFLIFLLSFL